MKKAGAQPQKAKAKSLAPTDVAEYIAALPAPARKTFLRFRTVIRSAVPQGAVEVISYRIPAFKDKKVLVWFAAFANHCSLFPTAKVINDFREELQSFSVSKGTIQFPLGKPLPEALIKQLVKARVAAAQGKQAADKP